MRAELPWNVAGIPPEAREAARAAARREGLSVGEWLTRRILRSFSGMEEELAPMAYENRASTGTALDSWGLPATSRHETEDMTARAGRSENESNEAWRRIEDQLRGLSRRLDSSERSQGDSDRALSRTAQEMNVAAREQTQAFDQLGETVVALNGRLERLERAATHDGIKEAVKALHQGLSRLADQITATANNSANQVVQLTANLEQLAGRVGQARQDWEEADKALDVRISDTTLAMGNRLEMIEQALDRRLSALDPHIAQVDTRLAAVEKTAQFNTNALDHALEKIDASANQRATDQVENQKRAARHEETLHRLEDSIARLEMRLPDAEFERRLDGIEHSVGGFASQFEDHGAADKFDASLKAISDRLDAIERDHNGLLTEMRSRAPLAIEAAAFEPPPAQPAPEPPAQEALQEASKAEPAPQAFNLPSHQEPQAEPTPQATEPPPVAEDLSFAAPPAVGEPLPAAEPLPAPEHEAVAEAALRPQYADEAVAGEPMYIFGDGPKPNGFAFDIPPENADPFALPEIEGVFTENQEPENFLAQARRSARAASEKAESEGRGRLGAFRWSSDAAIPSEEGSRPRYLLPALVVLLVIATGAAALILSQRARHSDMEAAPVTHPAIAKGPSHVIASPPKSHAAQVVAPPQSGQQGDETNFDTQRSDPAGQDKPHAAALPANPQDVNNVPANPLVNAAKPNPVKQPSAAPANDKVIQLANAGNPLALTILGLRALDGAAGSAVNLPSAVKFLSQAADKGEAVAQYRLGTLYGRGQGVAADPAKAMHWYELSANQGNRSAMHNLGVAYASGANKNMAESARWFAKAAALGLSDSQFNLAVLYERGEGVPQSLLDAYKWYSIAAAAGDGESKQRMSVLATQLSETDKSAANKSAAGFRAAPLNRSANVPPQPADLGG